MATYRLYRLDKAGRIEFADWIEADGDAAAGQIAFTRLGDDRFELWQRGRMLMPQRSQQGG